MPKTQKTPPKPQKADFTMKRAKQRYRSTLNLMGEGAKMPSLKKWIKDNHKSFGNVNMSEKLEKLAHQ